MRRITGKQAVVLFSGEKLVEENDSQLQSEIFDGVTLTMSTTITLFVLVDKKYTIKISPVSIKNVFNKLKTYVTLSYRFHVNSGLK